MIAVIYWKVLGNFPRIRGLRQALIKADSGTVEIYSGRIGRDHTFTVYWRAAGRSHRKTFSHEKEAQKFAREQAESLAAGQVQSPTISSTEVSTFREAERRLGDTAPIHVAARAGPTNPPCPAIPARTLRRLS